MRSLDVPRTEWLDHVLAEFEELSGLLAAAAPGADEVDRARDLAAVATLQLDGSPITEVPPPVDQLPVGTAVGPARGGWLEVLRGATEDLEEAPDEVLMAVEHHGARAGLDADDLAPTLRSDPTAALRGLHARMTDGLLAPAFAGAPRRTKQAVNDASIGRVVFFPVDPVQVPERLERAAAWVVDSDDHPVVVSGVLHHQVLDIHPFEAANGRLARIAARLLLATSGLDTERVGQPEQALLADSIGYLDEVARSRRLGDPGAFVTRWAEALADGLRDAARGLGVLPEVDVPHTTVRFLADRAGRDFTVADHRRAGGDDEGLQQAQRAGLAHRLLGTRGLRWRARGTGPAAAGPGDGTP